MKRVEQQILSVCICGDGHGRTSDKRGRDRHCQTYRRRCQDVLNAVAQFPGVVELTLAEYAATQEEEGKLDDLLIGFLDPAEYVAPAAQVLPGQQKDDDDSAEEEKGADPALAAERMLALQKQFKKTMRAIKKFGRGSAQGKKELTPAFFFNF